MKTFSAEKHYIVRLGFYNVWRISIDEKIARAGLKPINGAPFNSKFKFLSLVK